MEGYMEEQERVEKEKPPRGGVAAVAGSARVIGSRGFWAPVRRSEVYQLRLGCFRIL